MGAADVQNELRKVLVQIFGPDLVKSEWCVKTDATDGVFDEITYAPRLDIAVGPFNTTRNRRNENCSEIRAYQQHPFIKRLHREVIEQNQGGFFLNQNPRCLVAFELEFGTSAKHTLGGITNASMLGHIGVMIGSKSSIGKIQRIHAYACKLREVEKAHDDMFANICCFEESEFFAMVERFFERQAKPAAEVNY